MRPGRSLWILALVFFSFPPKAGADDKPWLEVRSPHFRVLTDASADDARRVAGEFEQLRAVFASQYPTFRLESGAPLLIFAARNEDTARTLAPNLWKMGGEKPAGYFQQSWEKKYAMIRMDTWGAGAHQVVFHEYTHSVLHLNFHWLPTWLDEGMAEFYAYTQFRGKDTVIGAPTERYRALIRGPLIPIATLITVSQRSPYYHDPDKVQRFYAECWALVHYMIFSPNMGAGKKLGDFFTKVQRGASQKDAFQEAFGSFQDMDTALEKYVRQFELNEELVKNAQQVNVKDYPSRILTVAETQAELGGYHLWTHDLSNARTYATAALQSDPKLGLAHEEQGFIDFSDGKDADSVSEFMQAFACDNTLYLSLFAETMLSSIATSNEPADEEAFRKALSSVLAINPQYAPAYVQLARLAIRQNDLRTAFAYSRKAEDLEPFRAGYHLQTGEILLRAGRGSDAANFAKYVAENSFGPDHNEALELWNRVPESQRPPSEPITESAPKDTEETQGIIKSVTCGKDETWSLNLDHDGQTLRFQRKGAFPFGFSDSLWYGEDHITLCYHLEGARAVVHFRPTDNSTYAGDIAEIEIRDDVVPPPSPINGSPPATAPINPNVK
jgi:tetratricopeptide (TPR) repeat protein